MGETFGPWEILRPLAKGGMAEVHLARRAATGDIVVLKRILPELARRPDFIGMFAEEARLMGQLQPHPHVVRLLQAGHINGVWYQALGHVDGAQAQLLRHLATISSNRWLVLKCLGVLLAFALFFIFVIA